VCPQLPLNPTEANSTKPGAAVLLHPQLMPSAVATFWKICSHPNPGQQPLNPMLQLSKRRQWKSTIAAKFSSSPPPLLGGAVAGKVVQICDFLEKSQI
jgi:hypothetical protein